jgi:predicted adenylyl cyclase CyaB
MTHVKKHSVRTRWIHNKSWVILVIKASLDEHTSYNGVSRIEFEPTLDMTIEQIDQILLDSWFEYLSKRSRERQEYELPEIHISLDKNAGYGYLAEFEMVINGNWDTTQAQKKIKEIMTELQVEELDQWRLERMFAFYNKNRPDYYGTENVFVIE